MLHRRKPAVTWSRHADAVMVFARLRIELADHPGALAAVTRVLAGGGLNVVEVSIHESEPPRAVDEIVVHAEEPLATTELATALTSVGAELLSVAPCDMRGDPVVTALTWITATLEKPARKSSLATGVRLLTGIDPVTVFTVDEARDWPIVAAALSRGWPVVERLSHAPEPLRTVGEHGDGSGVWVLAAPDAPDPSLVVIAVRPYAIRFTATEMNRLAAVLDCRRRLTMGVGLRWREESSPDHLLAARAF
jgi:predicted amino acid-binding ACT domain protein